MSVALRLALMVALLALLVPACRSKPDEPPPHDADASTERPALAAGPVQAVHLERPVEVWHDRAKIPVVDALVLRVTVSNPMDFMPMGISDPLFLLDDWICLVLQDPLVTGEAVLLAPRLPAPATLWVSPRGEIPEKLSSSEARRLREQMGGRATAWPVVVAPPAGAAVRLLDVQELREWLRLR